MRKRTIGHRGNWQQKAGHTSLGLAAASVPQVYSISKRVSRMFGGTAVQVYVLCCVNLMLSSPPRSAHQSAHSQRNLSSWTVSSWIGQSRACDAAQKHVQTWQLVSSNLSNSSQTVRPAVEMQLVRDVAQDKKKSNAEGEAGGSL